MDQTAHLPTKPGLQQATFEGLPVAYARHTETRARHVARRVARARRWLETTLGHAPAVHILVLDAVTWPTHARFPVFGMPHYGADHTLIVAGEAAPFLQGLMGKVRAAADQDGRRRMDTTYGSPPDPMAFFDLLAVHELVHLYQTERGTSLAEGWLSELHCNLVLHGYVAQQEPAALPALSTMPEIGSAQRPFRAPPPPLAAMHDDVAVDPDTYGWYQMNLHVLAAHMWDAHQGSVLRRFEDGLFPGEPLDTPRLHRVSPLLAKFHAEWPNWRTAQDRAAG